MGRGNTIDKYLAKRADLTGRPLISGALDGIEHVVVIPALAERDYLFETLESLRANTASELRRTLVVCVVNNRAAPHAEPVDIEDNRQTLEGLDALVHGDGALRVAYVDASSPGRELPAKDGAGLARKIGLDWGLALLHERGATCPLLFSLDADALVAPNYLDAVRAHFEAKNPWAGVVAYAHQLDGTPEETAAVVCYELLLRYHSLGLRYAGSPYALHAIGSTIVCRAEAYGAVSGMNRRLAGEDFYFLEKLIKTGRVDSIKTTTVYPSGRASSRCPFGTGPRVRDFPEANADSYLVYHPESYEVLREWLAVVAASLTAQADELLSRAETIHPELRAFLEASCFERNWDNLRQNSPGPRGLHDQFHRWFDGLKTLRLIHRLRDHGLPRQDLFGAMAALLAMAGQTPPVDLDAGLRGRLDRNIELLEFMRTRAL